MWGINKMLEYEIIITPESKNLEIEFSNYIWNDKKSGLPIDAFNHGIDSVRYALTRLLNQNIQSGPVGLPNLI
jgi:phage terminase large subunit